MAMPYAFQWIKGVIEALQGEQSVPIDRQVHVRRVTNQDGKPVVDLHEAVIASLSADGSIDQVTISQDSFYHCGCSTEFKLGGACAPPCNKTCCVQCFGRCADCQRPCCLECSQNLEVANGGEDRLCRRCHDARKRRQLTRQVGRVVLAPFIEFEREENA